MAEDVREKERKREKERERKKRERERETGLLDHFWPYVWAHVPCMTHCLQNRGGSFSAKNKFGSKFNKTPIHHSKLNISNN
jgi:hypothetical protein